MASNDSGKWNPDKFIKIFQESIESYEKEHPHWHSEVLVSMIGRGLLGLKRQIEDPDRPGINWDNAFVELHYPVDWDWNDGSILEKKLISGKFTAENTADAETTQKTVNELLVRHLNILALQDFTHHLWLEKRKGQSSLNSIIPAALHEKLSGIKDPSERQAMLEEFAHPFSVGAALIDYENAGLKDGAPVPPKALKQLQNIQKLMDIPPVRFSGSIGTHKIEISLVFQIHPLTIDYELKSAYHSITVGLFVVPELIDGEIVDSTPANWQASDQADLWRELFREVAKLKDLLIPKAEIQNSVILSLNAEFEISAASANEVRKKILDAVQGIESPRKISMKVIKKNERRPQKENTKPDEQSGRAMNNNPWISGSFYLFAFVAVTVLLAVIIKLLPIWVLPLVIVGGLLSITIISAFQLRNDGRITEKNFLTLMKLAFQRMPLLGKFLRKPR